MEPLGCAANPCHNGNLTRSHSAKEPIMKLWIPVLSAALALVGGQQATTSAPAAPKVGKPAPVLRLNDHTGKAVSIGANEDGLWTVLAFYPKAATPG